MALRVAARINDLLNPTLIDYNAPLEPSTFVAFFHGWPRYGRGNQLDFTAFYALTIILVALPFVIVSAVCGLFASSVTFFHGGKRRRGVSRTDVRQGSESDQSSSLSTFDVSAAGFARIAGGLLLFAAAVHLVGLAFVANHFFYSGFLNVVDLSEAAGTAIVPQSVRTFDTIRTLIARANDVVPGGIPGFDVPKFVRALATASDRFAGTVANVRRLTAQLRYFGNLAFWLAAAVCLLLAVGVLLLFSTAFPRRKQQRIAMGLYVIPLVVSWLCVAIITASAVVAGDLCVQLADFQKIVLVQSASRPNGTLRDVNVTGNLFIRTRLQCPQQLAGDQVNLGEAADSLAVLLRSDMAIGVLRVLYPLGKVAELRSVQRWIVPAMKKAVDCTVITRLAGHYMFAFCRHRGPITALFVAWGSTLSLAVLLTIAYLLTQFTFFEASRFLTPYINPDQDIYEAIAEAQLA